MPMPVISIAQMREWENATWKSGQIEAEVIRRVGKAVAELAIRLTRPTDLIIVLAGRGHNGADARNALEQLEERRIDVLQVHDPETDFPELETLLQLRPALIIDGLFGIGINRPLDAAWIRFIQRINEAMLKVLAVDVPSGLNADTGEPQGAAIIAAMTLTVGAPKAGLLKRSAWPYVGRLAVTDEVGLVPCPFAAETLWTATQDFRGFPPVRPVAGHKGTFGHLAIVAGSMGYHGAAVLAARAAQRARPGLITLFPHPNAYASCAAQLQAVMVQPWNPGLELSKTFNAVLAGPGLASTDAPDELKQSINDLWRTAEVPMVVDASALDWLVPGATRAGAIRVITPHPGEAARLLKKTSDEVQEDRSQAVKELSRLFGECWVVLKGHQTRAGRSTGEIFINSSGNPGLAQGGSGDVLSGFLAGLLAQETLQVDPLKTIRYAVWQHGATADVLETQKPNWIVEELAEALGQ
ncbi:MAG: NAD(P)H-hydrate dehydratase [Akkermansiaceae bacterium]|nr:NAD(P)H-hydrate dehydratase [Verrucomicrobiales bacterium]